MPQLYVQVLNPGGRKLTVEGEGEMTVLDHKWRVYQQDPAAHPGLQRLIFGSAELADASTLAECCEMLAEAELKVMVSPAAQIVVIIVGGIKHVTTLATLLSRPGTPIFEMALRGCAATTRRAFRRAAAAAPWAPTASWRVRPCLGWRGRCRRTATACTTSIATVRASVSC